MLWWLRLVFITLLLRTSRDTHLWHFKLSKKEPLMRTRQSRVDSDFPRVDLSFCSNTAGRPDMAALEKWFPDFPWSGRLVLYRVDSNSTCQKTSHWIFLCGSTSLKLESTRALHLKIQLLFSLSRLTLKEKCFSYCTWSPGEKHIFYLFLI